MAADDLRSVRNCPAEDEVMILTTPNFTREQIERWIEWFDLAAYEAKERYNADNSDIWALREWKECEKQADSLGKELP